MTITRNDSATRLSDKNTRSELTIELSILNGFISDPYLLKKSLSEGFDEKLLKSVAGRKVFQAIQALHTEDPEAKIDLIAVQNKLKELRLFDNLMEDFFDRMATAQTPQLSQVIAYIKALRKGSYKHRLLDLAAEISEFVTQNEYAEEENILGFMGELSKKVREIEHSQSSREIQLVKAQMIKIAQDIAFREREGERECIGYPLKPFNCLSEAISGLRRGFLYGIAGAPHRGKTNFTLDIATIVAMNTKIPVLFYTWEQTALNLTYRLLAKETRINPDTLQRKKVRTTSENTTKFATGWHRMEGYMNNLYVVEGTKDDTVDRIRAAAYNAMQDHKGEEVVIICDYIQKMPLGIACDSEKFRVEEISTMLKRLSIELNCPVIVISSLNKEGCLIDLEKNDSVRPGLYHCKGSGDIEYDLDCAMILSKDWGDSKELLTQMTHMAESMEKDHIHLPKIDIINVYLDKNRDAPEGKPQCIQYFFFVEENRFFELGYKETTNAFRYNKIEALLKKLMAEGFVQFKEIEGKMPKIDPPPADDTQ